MLTEDEAREKWCPHVRLGDEQGASASINRTWGRGELDAARCIASKCMAWRWVTEIAYNDEFAGETKRVTTGGYCGLAGPSQ